MTWTFKSSGHHNTSDWVNEEYSLLRSFVEAIDADETVTSSFTFYGNHVSAESVQEAMTKLAEHDLNMLE